MLNTSENQFLNEPGTDPDSESIKPGVLQLFCNNLHTILRRNGKKHSIKLNNVF